MAQVDVIEVESVPEPEQPEEGVFALNDHHREGVDAYTICECRHTPAQHADGPCTADDSYGVECECPSYVQMSDGDGDEA